MLKKIVLLNIIIVGILLQGCNHSKKNNVSNENNMVASTQYTLMGLDNKTYTIINQSNQFILKNTKAKLVILDLFATWCPPCRAEASRLAQIQQEYPNSIKIIGLSIQQDITSQKLQSFRQNYGANYTLLYSNENQELTAQIASTLPNVGRNFPIPIMAIYKDGILVKYFIGAAPQKMITTVIDKLLGK